MTIAEKVIAFNRQLSFTGTLPEGIQIMNPFRDNPQVNDISGRFYTRFYSDNNPRTMVLGINPGRFGAGTTGIPFTDTKRLNEKCGIGFTGFQTYEPSSSFVYEMIDSMGGVNRFYGEYLVSAICPLGFTAVGKSSKPVNYNYYDSKDLMRAIYPFVIDSLKKQISFGINTSVVFCLGKGQNEKFLRKLNEEHHLFSEIISLEHPRYIMQYRSGSKQIYIDRYVNAFHSVTGKE